MVIFGALDDLVLSVPADLIGSIKFLITILQAVGWFIIIYIIFNIINTIINRKRNKRLDKIAKDLEELIKIMKKKK